MNEIRRAQSLELNSNASLQQQSKKSSIPFAGEPKFSYGWLRRSAPNVNRRTTVVPLAILNEEFPTHFESTMQSMCLAFFTLAYAELIDGAVFFGNSMILHGFLKFLTILSIGLALLAAFASIRVFIASSSQVSHDVMPFDSPKIYSTIARIGSITVAMACGIIICVFAAFSLYITFTGKTTTL